MNITSLRRGYIFLITVLVVGVIASATATSLMLLGWAAEQNGIVVVESTQAFEYAQTCAERALLSLRNDMAYTGNETFTFDRGSCTVRTLGGEGAEDRSICVSGTSNDSVRRLEIVIDSLFPTIVINAWQEVTAFTQC